VQKLLSGPILKPQPNILDIPWPVGILGPQLRIRFECPPGRVGPL
jgi:hypothetical protein